MTRWLVKLIVAGGVTLTSFSPAQPGRQACQVAARQLEHGLAATGRADAVWRCVPVKGGR
jgi:hypothetical protein